MSVDVNLAAGKSGASFGSAKLAREVRERRNGCSDWEMVARLQRQIADARREMNICLDRLMAGDKDVVETLDYWRAQHLEYKRQFKQHKLESGIKV